MMRAVLWGLVLWLAGLDCARASAPDVPLPRQFSVLDGLPSNTALGIAEDRQGYLWVATRDGLARYDGVGFRVWRIEDGLRDNFVWWVHVDARDRVWIGTKTAGLAMLDEQRRTFRYYDRASHPEIGSNSVWVVDSDSDGAVWFGTDAGLHRLSPDGRIRRYTSRANDPRSLPSDDVIGLGFDAHGALWVATRAGAARWTGRDFERVAVADHPGATVDLLSFDDTGNVWIGIPGHGHVRRRDGSVDKMPWQDPVLDEAALHMLLRDRQGAHWLDTRSGLAREVGGEVQNVPLYSNTSRGLVRPNWAAAYEDREGGLWFVSNNSGLWHVPANWRNFSVLSRRLDDPGSPANAFVYGVAPASDNGLWLVGTGGMLDWLDPQTGRVEHRLARVCGERLNYGVLETRAGVVWVGCEKQLVRFDPRSGAVRRWMHGDAVDPAPEYRVKHMVEQRDGTLWFAGDDGVQIRDREGRVVDEIRGGHGNRGLPQVTGIRQMMRAPDGGLWLATAWQGLLMWNDGARRFEPVPGAPDGGTYGFAIASSDVVWLAGMGTLSAYRWNGAELIHRDTIGARQGMPKVEPNGVAIDGTGTLWMTTVRGLIRYDPKRQRVRIYGLRDGLPSQEFSESPIHQSPLGYLAVGTADGLLLFHPQHVQWSDRTPQLAIESADVRRGQSRVDLPHGSTVLLRHDDRDLRVVARLLSFTDAHAHRYRFRLDGYDPEWVVAERGGERTFPRLASGTYRLNVQARTADGDWTPSQHLDFRVQPPWWRTAWALVLVVITLLALLWWIASQYRLRLKRRSSWQLAVRERELAEQASQAKTRFLATLGHEVRTPMTGVLGMGELLAGTALDAKQRRYVDAIRRAGEHLMRLVNDALDLARIEAGKLELEPQAFDLHALIEEVIAMTAPMAKQRGLEFRSRVAADAPRWLHGDPGRVRQILLNLLGNAIKFTERGSVSLKVSAGAPGVRFVVCDTGPGLNDEQKARLFHRFEQAEGARTAARYGGSGLGLAICQELAAAMGGRITLDSTPGQGTDFTVELPLPDSEAPIVGTAPATRAAHSALHLLLVEDDATVAEVIVGLLHAQGHRVVHVAHGLAALAEAASATFDMALLDLDLPGLDGLALARQLRARGIAYPLLAVTARADADAEPLARAAGFDGFLRKPLTGTLLAEAIEALLPTADSGLQARRER